MPQLPSSIRYLPRRAHVFYTAFVVYLILKATQFLNWLLRRDDDASDAAWSRANTRAARAILATSSARRGLWIKCCQYVAARTDALPPEYANVLSKSLDDCPPSPERHVRITVDEQLREAEFGKAFREQNGRDVVWQDVFEHFDARRPIASASIAQVHVATVRATGRKVVLKIQHPGVRPMLLQDLEDLNTLLRWIAGAEPRYDMRPVLDAWIEMVPLETDFVHEMNNLIAVRDALRAAPNHLHATAYVPEPLPEFTSEKLFVMEFVDGCKINDVATLDKFQVDKTRLVTEISKSFGCQLFVCNVFSGDPHPGNFLVHRLSTGVGDPVLLDFGICVCVTPRIRFGFAKLVLSAIHNDSYSLIDALQLIGVELNRADPTASLDIVKYLLRTTAPRDESRAEMDAMRKRMNENEQQIKQNENDMRFDQSFSPRSASNDKPNEKQKRETRAPVEAFPGDLVFFFRSLGMLRGLAVALEVRHSYLNTLKPYAEYEVTQSCPEEERMKEVVYRPLVAHGVRSVAASKVLARVFDHLYKRGMMIGMQVSAYRNGKMVLSMAAGRRGRYNERPVQQDTIFNSFSTTKGVTAILFASIQDDFGVEYDDLVTKYWPEYGQNGKEQTTIGHILSHSSGLARALPEDMSMLRVRDDWQGIIKHLEEAAPANKPGERMEYHALTFGWLIAGLLFRITGKTYQTLLSELSKKLGIEGECFCGNMPEDLVKDNEHSRVANVSSQIMSDLQNGPIGKVLKQQFQKQKGDDIKGKVDNAKEKMEEEEEMKDLDAVTAQMKDGQSQLSGVLQQLNLPSSGLERAPPYLVDVNFFNHPIIRAGFMPSANGHFSARALAKLYGALANDGVVDGIRILAPGRARKMQQVRQQLERKGSKGWGGGVMIFDCKRGNNTTECGAMGHGGIGGSFAFAIPSQKFSMAVTLNRLNAVSVSAMSVIAVACKVMDVAMPVWYAEVAERLRDGMMKRRNGLSENERETKEEWWDGDGDNANEHAVMEMLVDGADGLRVLVG